MLAIQKYIIENGLESAIDKFKLICRDYGHKILLKYQQIESDFSFEEVRDCRGLVLEKGTWKLMSLPFRKFFNYGESHAAQIDWNTAKVFDKVDGSLIQIYWDWVLLDWCIGTSGTADGSGFVDRLNTITYAQLVKKTLTKMNLDHITDLFADSRSCYIFELTTPYNIVVVPHKESKLTLLSIRLIDECREINNDIVNEWAKRNGIPIVKAHNFISLDRVVDVTSELPYDQEGYIVCDGNFNRIKIKSPSYVAMHHFKGKNQEHNILELIKSNEIDEYIVSFPDRKDEILQLNKNFHRLLTQISSIWSLLEPYSYFKLDDRESKKKFAERVFIETDRPMLLNENESMKRFTNLYFSFQSGKIVTLREGINNIDNRELYNILIKL